MTKIRKTYYQLAFTGLKTVDTMCGDANQDCYLAIRFANSFIYSPHCVFAVFRGLEPDERMTYAHIAFLSMKAA